jgi:hypothetical protein
VSWFPPNVKGSPRETEDPFLSDSQCYGSHHILEADASLTVKRSLTDNPFTVMTLFVNPMQVSNKAS